MNSASVNLYGYYNNYIFLYNFTWLDVGEFWVWLAKMWSVFYYIGIDASLLIMGHMHYLD